MIWFWYRLLLLLLSSRSFDVSCSFATRICDRTFPPAVDRFAFNAFVIFNMQIIVDKRISARRKNKGVHEDKTDQVGRELVSARWKSSNTKELASMFGLAEGQRWQIVTSFFSPDQISSQLEMKVLDIWTAENVISDVRNRSTHVIHSCSRSCLLKHQRSRD